LGSSHRSDRRCREELNRRHGFADSRSASIAQRFPNWGPRQRVHHQRLPPGPSAPAKPPGSRSPSTRTCATTNRFARRKRSSAMGRWANRSSPPSTCAAFRIGCRGRPDWAGSPCASCRSISERTGDQRTRQPQDHGAGRRRLPKRERASSDRVISKRAGMKTSAYATRTPG
jgi:hypothetical protein